jgi:predicted alpha/beta superfamily hydrolase
LKGEPIKKVKKKSYPGRDEIVGTTRIFNDFHSSLLDNYRNIIVWLPPGYRRLRNVEKRYPVLYMHDGQNIVDPNTSFNGMDWRVDETIVKLIKAKKMQEIIVVGIYNTPGRLEEYSDTKKGNLYIKFICEELKPFIDNNFRTLPERESTGIMGSSMGGLISFIAGWKHSDIFSMVGSMSSSFYYNDEKVFDMVNPAGRPKNKIKIYIDHGEDGLIRGQKMFNRLSELGYIIGKDIDYFYAPGGEHNENAWAERLERPLLFFFGTKNRVTK